MASAVKLLERATALLASDSDTSYRAEVLGSLLIALSETGQFETSGDHAATIEEMADRNLDSRKVAALHVQLANLEHMAGRWSAALTQVATARAPTPTSRRSTRSPPTSSWPDRVPAG